MEKKKLSLKNLEQAEGGSRMNEPIPERLQDETAIAYMGRLLDYDKRLNSVYSGTQSDHEAISAPNTYKQAVAGSIVGQDLKVEQNNS